MSKLRSAGEPVPVDEVGKVRGVVFVRTPTDNHRRYLDVGKYLPGGDLFLLKLAEGETLETAKGTPVNLTAAFHPGVEADVRAPDVRYHGRAAVFAMRVGEEDSLNLYELSLDPNLDLVEGSFRRLTYVPATAGGLQVHFTDPTYVPDPSDAHAADGESCLIEKLYGRESKADRPLTGDRPHPSAEPFQSRGLAPAILGDEERLLLVRWIDLGAAFKGPDPGAVGVVVGAGR